jgi:hypothetical protein
LYGKENYTSLEVTKLELFLLFQELDHTYPKFTSEEDRDQNILNKDDAVEVPEV